MDLQNYLIEALKERFKANATVKAIEKQIIQSAENIILKKYSCKKVFADGLEFELGGVNAELSHFQSSLTLDKLELKLVYFCASKLPKAKREKLKTVKEDYKKDKYHYLPWNNYNVAIWREIRYSIDIDKVLSGHINLSIEL